MARILLLIVLLLHPLLASVLLNENVYERQNRVDLMLSFDTPFGGKVRKKNDGPDGVTIVLEGVQVRKPFYKSLRGSFVESIAITRAGEARALVKVLPAKGPLKVQASKTVDGFGLRLRFQPASAGAESAVSAPAAPAATSALSSPKGLELKKEREGPGWRYWLVMGLLLVLLLVLWVLRKKGLRPSGGGWLMPKSPATPGQLPPEAVIRFQKALDPHNRLLLVEFGAKQYLMVVGNTNLLLDTFVEGRIEAEDDFSKVFEANKRQLDHFLRENHPDAYEAFKANASKEEHL